VLHAPRRRAAGSTSSSVSTTTCLHGWVMLKASKPSSIPALIAYPHRWPANLIRSDQSVGTQTVGPELRLLVRAWAGSGRAERLHRSDPSDNCVYSFAHF